MNKAIKLLKRSRIFVVTSLLVLITVIFFTQADVYIPDNHNLLPDYQEKNLLRLTKSKQGAEITDTTNNELWQLSNTATSGTRWIDLDINASTHYDTLYLSADIKSTIEPEQTSGQQASADFMLLSQNKQQEWDYQAPHLLAAITSTQDWTHYEAGFKTNSDATLYRISANLAGLTGSLLIKNITLHSAEKSLFYRVGYYSLLSGWMLLLLYLATYLSKHFTGMYEYWPLFAVLAFIIIGILLPADIKYSLLTQVHTLLSTLGVDFPLPGVNTNAHHSTRPLLPLDKTGHLIAFGTAGFILAWKGKSDYKEYLPILILFAITTETLQYFIPGRNPLMMDVAIDAGGIIVGASLAYLLRRRV